MPNIDPENPDTFSVVRTTPGGYDAFMSSNYRYLLSVTPTDPTKYSGPSFVSVSSDHLMSENEVLAEASNMALERSRYGNFSTTLDINIVDAFLNPALADNNQ